MTAEHDQIPTHVIPRVFEDVVQGEADVHPVLRIWAVWNCESYVPTQCALFPFKVKTTQEIWISNASFFFEVDHSGTS